MRHETARHEGRSEVAVRLLGRLLRLLAGCVILSSVGSCGGTVETASGAQVDAGAASEASAEAGAEASLPGDGSAQDISTDAPESSSVDAPSEDVGPDTAAPCAEHFADCNHQAYDGCEVNLGVDDNNCGACGKVCALSHAIAVCSEGVCLAAECDLGFADCDGLDANGCEVYILGDINNCGLCGKKCAEACVDPPPQWGCKQGLCSFASCIAGHADCDGDVCNGCETDTVNDLKNCGACGNDCTLKGCWLCSMGACMGECPAGMTICTECYCVDLATDNSNCGACGLACNAGDVCVNGLCVTPP